ncbi:hypothetical protein D6029_19695 [Buttiauxella izardii]|uniref:Uncharacterized protein n=1 Tax=Buttiauxella izardii TaxID=82991 RepID=A0A3A5JKL0_9ENTR|nr:hypothetical protein D6029_19695 [Buttiauxella izardii]
MLLPVIQDKNERSTQTEKRRLISGNQRRATYLSFYNGQEGNTRLGIIIRKKHSADAFRVKDHALRGP